MKTISAIYISILLCTVALVSVHAQKSDRSAPRGAASAPQKWEHLGFPRDASEPFSDPEFAKRINKLGNEGWELITVLNFTKEGTTTKTVYYFKRPLE